jgi:hypothetical protein
MRTAHSNPSMPALLIIDGHNSRESPITTQLLQDANIDCVCIPAHSSMVLQPLDLSVNGVFKCLLGKHFESRVGEPRDLKRQRLLHTSGLCLNATLNQLYIQNGFARAGIYPFVPTAPFNSTLVRDPCTQFIPERPAKKKKGVDISGKLLTDGMTIAPIHLPTELPVPQIAAPAPPKPRKKRAKTTTEVALAVVEK